MSADPYECDEENVRVDDRVVPKDEEMCGVLADEGRIVMSASDLAYFLSAVSSDPPAPTPKALAAVKRYKEHRPISRTAPVAVFRGATG